ncbi:hypothetical protein [Bradyrhizobium sp. SSUT77]|uniref:hypothetical protein n=1 Tax=Bradyrhizobium sp. SSUT77 TaxID=3040603 RepID=UPI002447E1F8|nr:hypothetical protein [Bradyrhizobium sp. SSUT77]MDH2346807.1 hypothetical protein [Bradyrhizobium sp. SSUT77]
MAMQPVPMPQQAPAPQQQPYAPYPNQPQWSPEQLDQMRRTRLQPTQKKRTKDSPAIVTSVLSDILVFAETQDADGEPRCLSFRPNKIAGYKGEPLQDIGIFPGAPIAAITWDIETTIVQSVTVQLEGSAPLAAAGA